MERGKRKLHSIFFKNKEFPDSDVIVLNGFPLVEDKELKEGDRVVFIKRELCLIKRS